MNLPLARHAGADRPSLVALASPVLIIGAAYSGKSELAHAAVAHDRATTVIGTADPNEAAFTPRLAELRKLRPAHWRQVDAPTELPDAFRRIAAESEQVVIDSLNQWIAAKILEGSARYDFDQLESQVLFELDDFCRELERHPAARIVMVTSEVGAGISPPAALPRLFRQITARANCRMADVCRSVVLVSAGIPLILKG